MAPKNRFSDGEKVLCFHGPLLYEAKCMKTQIKEKHVKYYIHYSGWNKNWDEWVPESRVLKFNDANLAKQKELQLAHGKAKKTKTIKSSTKKDSVDRESSALPAQEKVSKHKIIVPTTTSTTDSQAEIQRKKRTRAEQTVETEEEYIQKLEIKVKIPDELKHWLVDDWDLIVRQKKLMRLPSTVTVDTIIAEYVKQRLAVKGITPNKETAIVEVTNGIKEYFNVMLGKQLLYKFERPQHAEIVAENPDLTMTQIYGAIHLLRLFTKIGGALAYTPLDEETINLLSLNFHDFVKFLSKNATAYFNLSDYYAPSSDYLKKTTATS